MRVFTHIFWKIGCITFQFIPDQASNKQGYPKFQPVMIEKRECLLAYTHNLYQRQRSILKQWRLNEQEARHKHTFSVTYFVLLDIT